MADIEIAPLSDRMTEDEIAELARGLEHAGVERLPKAEDSASATVAHGIDDDVMAEFLDHLDASELACDVYLPIDFDSRVETTDLRVGSLVALIDVLDDLREDLSIEEEEKGEDEEKEPEDEEEGGYEIALVEKQIRQLWHFFYDGAHAAIERHLPLFVVLGK